MSDRGVCPQGTGPSLAGLTAALLVGGLGTRLRAAVSDRPKVLAPVRGRPFLAYLLDQVAACGVTRAVLCTGYRGEQVREAFGDSYGTLALVYSQEPEPRGTAGALAFARPYLDGERVLVMNGDSYCAADFDALGRRHAAGAAAATIVLAHVEDTSRYGSMQVDAEDRVLRFQEKGGTSGPGWINAGIYLLARAFLAAIPPDGAVSIERDLFPRFLGRGLRGMRTGGRFIDIGTPASYAAAETFFAELEHT